MFKHKMQNRVPQDVTPDTAYKKARQEFTATLGSARASASNWRLMAFGMMTVALVSIAGAYYFANRSVIVPYIVEVDSRTGQVVSTAKIYDRTTANDIQYEYFIWQCIKKARTLPRDLVMYENNWNELYKFLDPQSSQKFNDMAIRENHQGRLKEGETTMLALKTITPLVSQDGTYNVRWTEAVYERDGRKKAELEYEGYFKAQQAALTDEEAIVNPLGIRIRDMSFSLVR